MAQIIPGILTNDRKDYVRRLKIAEKVAPLVQIDVVDGEFSKNKTVGIDVICQTVTRTKLEIQLMVMRPSGYIAGLDLDFVSKIIFPLECAENIGSTIKLVRNVHKQVGVSLNPDTEIKKSVEYLPDLDLLLLMTGTPGYSGQVMGEGIYDRIREAKALFPKMAIEVDIGVNLQNAKLLAQAGADYLVASSALYGSSNFAVSYKELAIEARVNDN